MINLKKGVTMAERRMFAKSIIDSDAFLDMPLSTQSLYFHLAMRADDDGFVNNPKKIAKMIGANDDEFKVLITKKFILIFESGIIVIKHWKIHNYIQKDRYKETNYIEEKALLSLNENNGYTLDTQVRLGKVSLELDKTSLVNRYNINDFILGLNESDEFKTSLLNWLNYGKKKFKTEKQWIYQYEKLKTFNNYKEVVNHSIGNGYQGLYAPKGFESTKKEEKYNAYL